MLLTYVGRALASCAAIAKAMVAMSVVRMLWEFEVLLLLLLWESEGSLWESEAFLWESEAFGLVLVM